MLFFIECSKVELLQEETRNLKENNAPKDKAPMKELPEVLFFLCNSTFPFGYALLLCRLFYQGTLFSSIFFFYIYKLR